MNRKALLVAGLAIYCALTLVPFYLLAVRSFVPTMEATRLHLWVPPRPELEMDARIGDLFSTYNLDSRELRRSLGIKGYLNPQQTLREMVADGKVEEAALRAYLEPFTKYNGILTVLKGGFLSSLLATVLVVGLSIAIGGALGIATGSVLAGLRRRWHVFVYNSYMLNMIIPPLMIMLPQYLILVRYFGLGDSYLSLILLNIKGTALSTMVFTAYIASIPKELKESAYMDGAGRLDYFARILLPLMGTPFAVYASVSLPWQWNDLIHPLLFLSPEKYTLPAFIATLGGNQSTNFEAIFSGVLLSLVPILAIYLALQKLFMRAATSGAVKG
ncbi:ABC-type glycerol-3-phosphate transport system permease component [Stella humosa]|uniref:ABC-type glycerol-3-phosphate transport system permease component n=1 Tax=Stella humosa TaxID=94 RepID=A0A3N1L7L9_9PROT|nr:carbohydrate ABC transporter permease [Stella humosa]ROP90623.1 ABC-type glycerol-3-phosphate transport system permease component [Stella humosa]BBK29481.1 hypothetical protein STHU_01150 [Stella humosa]